VSQSIVDINVEACAGVTQEVIERQNQNEITLLGKLMARNTEVAQDAKKENINLYFKADEIKKYKLLLQKELQTTLICKGKSTLRINISDFVKEKSQKAKLLGGIDILKLLVEICKENNWHNNYNIIYRIYLKTAKKNIKLNIEAMSLNKIINNMNTNKNHQIIVTNNELHTGINFSEKYEVILPNVMLEYIFKINFEKEYYMNYIAYKTEKDITKTDQCYERCINFIYY
jgi:hypothetical protein